MIKPFEKGQKVVKIITVMGIESATNTQIAKASKKLVQCEGDESLWYDAATGKEIDPVIPGCSSRLVAMDG